MIYLNPFLTTSMLTTQINKSISRDFRAHLRAIGILAKRGQKQNLFRPRKRTLPKAEPKPLSDEKTLEMGVILVGDECPRKRRVRRSGGPRHGLAHSRRLRRRAEMLRSLIMWEEPIRPLVDFSLGQGYVAEPDRWAESLMPYKRPDWLVVMEQRHMPTVGEKPYAAIKESQSVGGVPKGMFTQDLVERYQKKYQSPTDDGREKGKEKEKKEGGEGEGASELEEAMKGMNRNQRARYLRMRAQPVPRVRPPPVAPVETAVERNRRATRPPDPAVARQDPTPWVQRTIVPLRKEDTPKPDWFLEGFD
jgi:hypothetical protein